MNPCTILSKMSKISRLGRLRMLKFLLKTRLRSKKTSLSSIKLKFLSVTSRGNSQKLSGLMMVVKLQLTTKLAVIAMMTIQT